MVAILETTYTHIIYVQMFQCVMLSQSQGAVAAVAGPVHFSLQYIERIVKYVLGEGGIHYRQWAGCKQ